MNASRRLPLLSAALVLVAQASHPQAPPAGAKAGEAAARQLCGSCHALKRPSELSAERWQEEVGEMRDKNGVKLSDDEAQAIVRYLAVTATAG